MPIVPQNIPKPQQNRTEIGVRTQHPTGQPTALKKGRRARSGKTGDSKSSALDRIVREEENLLVDEVGDEPRRRGKHRQGYADLEAAGGHSTATIRRKGSAFRIDEFGRLVPPHFSDVEQGNLQDAWLLATLAAVADAQPGALIGRVLQKKNGDFTVRLGERTYPVTPEFSSEGYAEVEPRNLSDTLWVALVEKAFALESACSYAELEAGNPNRALPLLVEGASRRFRIRPAAGLAEAAEELNMLRSHRANDRPMVLISRASSVGAPFTADHAYAIVDVDREGGVKIYNPWGTRRASRPLDAVLFHLPWHEARSAFEFLYVGGID